MSIHQTKPIRERKPGPYSRDRHCPECHARLTSYNPGPLCARCNGGDWGTEQCSSFEARDSFADLMAAA